MSTQVPPSRLDSTKDFSSLVPSAFAKANAAFAQANNATDTWVRTQANNAYSQANAAFTAANTASGAAASSTPKISAIVYPGNDTAAATSGGQTVTLNGSGFNSGASVLINGTYASVVSVANSTSLSFTTPANSGGTYILYVINTDGGTGISVPGISYSGTPAWSNAAGSLATVYETANISSQLTATGDAGDLPITYSVYSGTLPPGSSLNTSTGLLSGTSQATASSTTYNFTIRATDAQNQDTDRAFSITINPDVVTWISPADGTITSIYVDQPMANVTLSANSAADKSISYTANALPTGVSISGNAINGTPTVIGNTISVITATSATTNRTATRTFTWVVSVGVDTYFKNTTLLLNGETTVTPFINDASNNSTALTIAGDTKPVLFNPYQGDGYYSNYFDGTGDYLYTSASSANAMGTGDYTVEAWIYATAAFGTTGNGRGVIISNRGQLSAPNAFMLQHYNGKIYFGTSSADVIVGSTTMVTNTWYHVVVSRSSGTVRLFLNGVSDATAVTGDSTNHSDTNAMYIGLDGAYGQYPFTGYISNARLVKGTAVYTANFTPPTSPLTAIANTSLLTCQSNRFIDKSTNAFTVTKTGDTTISSAIPFAANSSYSTYGSGYFDGTGDYCTTPVVTGYDTGTGTSDFTFEGWVYNLGYSGSQYGRGIITFYVSGSYNSSRLMIRLMSSSNSFNLYLVVGGTICFGTSGSGTTNTAAPYQWTHFAFVRTSGVFKFYINGVLDTTISNQTSVSFNGFNVMDLGRTQDGTVPTWNGYISDIRYVKGTAVYTANFTPPASPLTNITNTQLLTLQYNGGATNYGIIDNSNFNNIITRSGNATQGTFSPYNQTGWSNYFNGSTDYLSVAANSVFAFGTGDFTIEAWIMRTGGSGNLPICQSDAVTNSTSDKWWFAVAGGGLFLGIHSTSSYIVTTTTFNIGQWYHVAVTRTSGTMKMFIDGTSTSFTATGSSFNGYNLSQNGLTIGAMSTPSYWTGYISNLRITKSSLYTATFTPSTTPLIPTSNPSILTCQSNRFVDNGPNNLTLTTSGSPTVQAFSPFGSISEATPISYSNYFDGTGDYLSFPNNGAFAFGTGSFTIEFWINAPLNNNKFILSGRGGITSLHITTGGYNGNTTAGALRYGSTDVGTSVVVCDNTWHHCAIVRNGSSAVTMYVDGVSRATTTDSTNYTTTTGTWYVATNDSAVPGDVLTGHISNLRIVKGTALYTTSFTPSTTPLTAIANTSLLTCQSTRMIDNSTNAFTLTSNGDTKPRIFNPFGYTVQTSTNYTPSLHGGSAYFDGTGDYLNAGSGTLFNLSGDFTVEMWVYGSTANWNSGDAAGYTCLVDTRDQSNATESNRLFFGIQNSISAPYFYNAGTNIQTSSTITVSVGVWNHIAYVRSGSTIKIYVNGVQGASFTDSTSFSASRWVIGMGASIAGGSNNRAGLQGYISDHRVVKYAVYTSNFVPPAQTLTNYSTTYPSSLLLNFNNGGIVDQHSSNVLENVGNAQISTAVKKYNAASMSFNNSTQYLTIAPSQNLEFGSGDFTIEFWWYPTATGRQALYHGSVGADYSLGIDFSSVNTQKIGLFVSSNGSSWNLIHADSGGAGIGTTTPTQNAWNHIAVTRSGTTFMLFVNGNRDLNITGISGSIVSRATSQKVIGSWWNTTAMGQVSGYIDEFRVTKGYARYTASFTPPATALITR